MEERAKGSAGREAPRVEHELTVAAGCWADGDGNHTYFIFVLLGGYRRDFEWQMKSAQLVGSRADCGLD